MIRQVVINGKQLSYKLTYKNVRNINVRINSDRQICVSANRFISTEYIDTFLRQKADYILRAVEKPKNLITENEKHRTYSDGEPVYFLGDKYIIKVIDSDKCCAVKENAELLVYTDSRDKEKIRSVIKKWYDDECICYFGIIASKVYQVFKQYVSESPQYSYKYMVSRWGSCNPSKGKININKNLIKYDTDLIELVFYHEFTHLIYPDHSRKFYNFMSMVLPDHMERRKRLNSVSCGR